MKTTDAVRKVMEEQGIGVNQMAYSMNKSPRLVSERLSQENISISKLMEMLRVLDYKVAILPRKATLPEGGYDIE